MGEGDGGGTSWRRDWVTAHPISSGNSIPVPHPPDFPPSQQLQQLLAEARLAEVYVSACVYVGGLRGAVGAGVLPGHVKGDSAWVQLGWQEEVGQVGEWVVSDGQGAGYRGAEQPRGLTELVSTGAGTGVMGVDRSEGAGAGIASAHSRMLRTAFTRGRM